MYITTTGNHDVVITIRPPKVYENQHNYYLVIMDLGGEIKVPITENNLQAMYENLSSILEHRNKGGV